MEYSEKSKIYTPCLLTRLCDSSMVPESKSGLSIQRLRQDILQNISSIMQSRFRSSREEQHNSPEIIASVLGYGLRDLCGRVQSIALQQQLKEEVLQQLRFFEPRIDPDSLDVVLINDNSAQKTVIEMEIHGKTCVAQWNQELVFRSSFDLETGKARITFEDKN